MLAAAFCFEWVLLRGACCCILFRTDCSERRNFSLLLLCCIHHRLLLIRQDGGFLHFNIYVSNKFAVRCIILCSPYLHALVTTSFITPLINRSVSFHSIVSLLSLQSPFFVFNLSLLLSNFFYLYPPFSHFLPLFITNDAIIYYKIIIKLNIIKTINTKTLSTVTHEIPIFR